MTIMEEQEQERSESSPTSGEEKMEGVPRVYRWWWWPDTTESEWL